MPSATAREFQRVARILGFILKRQKDSHARWNHPDGRVTTIPVHGGGEIGPPLCNQILRQLGITLDVFQKLR
ncbi:MAG: type II toxin-antitoxin system HicA family toxin [Candidatus Acidiferrum sp.]|jgi:predicted RNA binding protein YcfA (HicA-like mRNA interferase family)